MGSNRRCTRVVQEQHGRWPLGRSPVNPLLLLLLAPVAVSDDEDEDEDGDDILTRKVMMMRVASPESIYSYRVT